MNRTRHPAADARRLEPYLRRLATRRVASRRQRLLGAAAPEPGHRRAGSAAVHRHTPSRGAGKHVVSTVSYDLRCCLTNDGCDDEVLIPPESAVTLALDRFRYEVYEKVVVIVSASRRTTPSGS